jgi:hypothetical protein
MIPKTLANPKPTKKTQQTKEKRAMLNNLFKTSPVRGAPKSGVDRSAKRINGVKVMQMGRVNDSRPWEVDADTLAQVVEYGNQPNKGTKARFTHPSMSDDGFGKYLGRWTNFRIEGDSAYADLQLAESSFDTPSGDLGTYVMDLAEEDPESFGVSAATSLAGVMYTEVPEGKTLPLRLDGLRAVDFVDEPAATRGGLFDMASPQGLPSLATWIVETHFADREPREVVERLCSFLSKHYGKDIMSEVLAGNQAGQQTQPAPASVAAPAGLSLDGAKPFIEAFGERGAMWYLQGRSIGDCFAIFAKETQEQNVNLLSQIKDLETRLEAATKASNGEETALSSEPRIELSDSKKAAVAKAEQLKSQGADDKSAKWAAALSN